MMRLIKCIYKLWIRLFYMNKWFFFILCLLSFNVNAHPIYINANQQTYAFEVEIANTPQKAAKGLMFRTNIPDFTGMLFIDKKDKIWHMWMKNTPSSLDMIFFTRNGTIVKIISDTIPYSLDILSSDTKVAGVLEVSAGTAKKLKIRVGDKISTNLFPHKKR